FSIKLMEEKKDRMKRNVNIYLLMFVFVAAMFSFNPTSTDAESIQDYDKKIKELDEEQSELKDKKEKVNKDKKSVDNKMGENKKSQKSVEEQMENIETELAETE